MNRILIVMIRFYQKFLSPVFPKSCRFIPTCSEYMIESIRKYGTVGGVCRGLLRVLRCHPFNPGGYDPA